MKTREHRASRRPRRARWLALLLTLIAAAVAAQTHHSGGSTTVIEQRGAGPSQSQVSVSADGQKVITRDGQSTDISIQRGSASAASVGADADRFALDDRLAPSGRSERFSPDRPMAEETLERWPNAEMSREGYRQRMLERLRPY